MLDHHEVTGPSSKGASTEAIAPAPVPVPGGAWAVPLLILALLLGWSPVLDLRAWPLRYAVVLLLAAAGLPALALLWRDRTTRSMAMAAAGFTAVAALATAAADRPLLALLGPWGWGTGLLFVAGIVGAWALGATSDPVSRRRIVHAVAAGMGVNVAVGIGQAAADLGSFNLPLFVGRSTGLAGNPVHLGVLAAGLAALGAWSLSAQRRAWAAALIGAGMAVQLSGSRAALLVALAAVVAAGLPPARRLRGAAATAFLVLGVGAGMFMAGDSRLESATERAAFQGQAGGNARLAIWTASVPVIAGDVLGAGPGRFMAATAPATPDAVARQEGADRTYADAHNLVVEYAVTTGPVGALALLVWLGLAARRARGPMAAGAAAMLALHLLQPQSVVTTPVAFLLLGCSMAAPARWVPPATRSRRWRLALPVAGGVAAAVTGLWVVTSAHAVEQAHLAYSIDDMAAAASRTPWPEPAAKAATMTVFEARHQRNPDLLSAAIRWRREAVRRDPANARWWNDLAETELSAGDLAAAEVHFTEAFRRNRASGRALRGLAYLSLQRGDAASAERFNRLLAAVGARPLSP